MSDDTILFLDFDGVLHPAGCRPQNRFCRLPLLADWLQRQAPHVGVVISSDWRLGARLDALRMHFPQPIRSRILGALPAEAEVDPAPWAEWAARHPRQCLIMAWLAAQGASPQLDGPPSTIGWKASAPMNAGLYGWMAPVAFKQAT